MKIAVMASLLAKRNMKINAGQFGLFNAPETLSGFI